MAKISLKWFVKVVIRICQNCCMHFLPQSKPKFGRGFFIYYCCDVRSVSGMSNRVLRVLKRGCVIFQIVDVFEAVNAWVRRALGNLFLNGLNFKFAHINTLPNICLDMICFTHPIHLSSQQCMI